MKWFKGLFCAAVLAYLPLNTALAIERGEVDTISVQAEMDLDIPLAQISSRFTRAQPEDRKPISVYNNFGNSAAQKKKIEDGESADVFITSEQQLVQDLKNKGMVDVYSISPIAKRNGKTYVGAVVAGENMTAARVFLDYLRSEQALEFFKQNGFETP